MRTIILLLGIAVTSTLAAGQAMYKWVDKDGKTHYTDSPPPGDAKKLAAPKSNSGGMAPAAPGTGNARAQGSFQPDEEAALRMVCAIQLVERLTCQMELNRACSMDEMVKGVKGTGLKRDPRSDPNYDYRVEVRGDDVAVSAVPRTAGLTGFLSDRSTYYNPGGAAGKGDAKIAGGIGCPGEVR